MDKIVEKPTFGRERSTDSLLPLSLFPLPPFNTPLKQVSIRKKDNWQSVLDHSKSPETIAGSHKMEMGWLIGIVSDALTTRPLRIYYIQQTNSPTTDTLLDGQLIPESVWVGAMAFFLFLLANSKCIFQGHEEGLQLLVPCWYYYCFFFFFFCIHRLSLT